MQNLKFYCNMKIEMNFCSTVIYRVCQSHYRTRTAQEVLLHFASDHVGWNSVCREDCIVRKNHETAATTVDSVHVTSA